jgi:hypothetical protein
MSNQSQTKYSPQLEENIAKKRRLAMLLRLKNDDPDYKIRKQSWKQANLTDKEIAYLIDQTEQDIKQLQAATANK